MSGYSSDEDVNIRFTRRRAASPPGAYGYVEPARQRPVNYFPVERPYLAPERTVIRARSRSRERYRQSPPASPPAPAPQPAPVIIHNQIYNDQDSDDDYRGGKLQVSRPRRERSRSRGSDDRNYMTREQYEMERTRAQLEEMRLAQVRDRRETDDRRAQHYRNDADLRNAKRELDEIKGREERAKEQERIKREMELERLKEEEREAEEKERREKEAAAAVEKFKQEEAERKAKEKKEKELAEKEYQRRLQEQLINSGLDEKHIEAILKKEKIKAEEAAAPPPKGNEIARPTYTRMSRRHLSIETLRVYHVDFDYDQDPEFVLIKRWVPEWEQNTLWLHTREIREKRSNGGRLVVDVGEKKKERRRSNAGDSQFEWVRKKGDSGSRRRSKSPALLMYLAGAKPA